MPLQRNAAIRTSPTILLKTWLSQHGDQRLLQTLSGSLSIFYGLSMVAQGHTAVLAHSLRRQADRVKSPSQPLLISPSQLAQLSETCSLLLEEIQTLSEEIGDLESFISDLKESSPTH